MTRAVFFDVGETLISEERVWTDWARWLGVPPVTFAAALGAVIERREHHLEVFRVFRDADFDVEAQRLALLEAGRGVDFDKSDLYPDALPCLRELKAAGYVVGVVGNQPPDVTEAVFGTLDVELDVVASSSGWELAKPDPAFFARVAEVAGLPASDIAYVGDRVDNDVLPAAAAGMTAVHIRRGPWGHVHATWPEVQQAHLRIDSLRELVTALTRTT
jgi:HAD superfamily hydrolase (TIGR01549 family)